MADSQDFVGSMELQSRSPIMKGKTDTIGSLGGSNSSLQEKI